MSTSLWTNALVANTDKFQKAFGELSAKQLNWKPSPERWSVAQNIDHLIQTNSTFFPILTELGAGTYKPHFNARVGFLVNFFGAMILKAVLPTTARKIKAVPAFEPSQSALPPDILVQFERHQQRLAKEMEASEPFLARVISSPAKRAVVYRLDRAFDILLAHEERHLRQAEQVLREMPT